MITTFTRKIFLEPHFQAEFFFNRIYTAGGIRFHVSVIDKTGELCHFDMMEKWNKWRIIAAPQPPEWVMKLQDTLDKIICECMLS